MPHRACQKYELSGWRSVPIYTESEMASALGISPAQLRQAISAGELCYHAHPTSNALREYQFNQGAYEANRRWWACLKSGGHHWQHESWIDRTRHIWRCQCGARRYD